MTRDNKMITKKERTLVSRILSSLMSELKIKESELARQTGLPQTTINRLLLGGTTDPRASTLQPIAKFFGVSIDQLLGLEPFHSTQIEGTFVPNNRDSWKQVPLISWEETLSWIFRKDNINLYSHEKWITTERNVSDASFAIISKPFMEPRFRKNSILITDPKAEYQDSKFVVISLDQVNVTVRQIIFDHSECYLKNFDNTIPTIKLEKSIHKILGVIIESRIDEFN